MRILALRGSFYKRLIDPSSEAHEDLSAGLSGWPAGERKTTYPILMMAFDLRHRGVLSDEDLSRTVSLIPSRFLCAASWRASPPTPSTGCSCS